MRPRHVRWTDVPPPHVVAIAITCIAHLSSSHHRGALVVGIEHSFGMNMGFSVAACALIAAGAWELASRQRGVVRAALMVAALASAGQVVYQLGEFAMVFAWEASATVREAWVALRGVPMILQAAVFAAFAFAAVACRQWVLGLGCAAFLFAQVVPRGWLDLSLLPAGDVALDIAALVVLSGTAAAISTSATGYRPAITGGRGLARAANALRARGVVVAAAAGAVVLLAARPDSAFAMSAVTLSTLAAALVCALSIGGLATGLYDAARAALSPLQQLWMAGVAGALWWSVGAAVDNLALYHHASSRYSDWGRPDSYIVPLFAAPPFLASCSVALAIFIALGEFARRAAVSGGEQLAQAVSSRRAAIAVLLLAGAAGESPYVLSGLGLGGAVPQVLLVVRVVALAAQFAGLAMASKRFALAARALSREAALPAARVVPRDAA